MNLNKVTVNLLIKANIIITKKNYYQLLSLSVNLLLSSLANNIFVFNLESTLDSLEELSRNKVLNNTNIEGKLTNFLNSVLFNNANIITQIWEGFKTVKNL